MEFRDMDVPKIKEKESADGRAGNMERSEVDRVLEALGPGDLLHTSVVASRAGLDINATGFLLARLHRKGKVVRFFPRKSNTLNEKLWQRISTK
jgi:hypothetical protein